MKRKLLYVSKSILALRSFATMLLFISAISVGWGDNYLIWKNKSATNWIQSSLGSADEVTVTLDANETYEFYLKDGSQNVWKFSTSNTVEIQNGTGYTLVQNTDGYNGTITNAAAGSYKFKPTWNGSTPILTVTFPASSSIYTPVLEKADEISCFYEVKSKDYSYIYAWTESGSNKTEYAGGWPGTQMKNVGTTADGKVIYKWTYSGSTAPAKVIFSVGNSSNQTSNLDFTNHGYYVDGAYNRTITAVAETKYSVTIQANEGGTVYPEGEQQVGSTAFNINATANTGYTFSNWTTTGGVSVTDANAASTTITATAAGSVKANFTSTSSDAYYLPNS